MNFVESVGFKCLLPMRQDGGIIAIMSGVPQNAQLQQLSVSEQTVSLRRLVL